MHLKYTLPTFTHIPESLDHEFHERIRISGNGAGDRAAHNRRLHELHETYPWLQQVFGSVLTNIGVRLENELMHEQIHDGMSHYRLRGETGIRSTHSWHVDIEDPELIIRMLVNRCSATYAGCDIEIDDEHAQKAKDMYNRPGLFLFSFAVYLDRLGVGQNWLELAGGLVVPATDQEADEQFRKTEILSQIIQVTDLVVKTPPPGTLAEGIVGETLHRSSPFYPPLPADRIFMRAIGRYRKNQFWMT